MEQMNGVNKYIIDFDSNVNAWADVWTKSNSSELLTHDDSSSGGEGYYVDVGFADFYLGLQIYFQFWYFIRIVLRRDPVKVSTFL